jgi:DNA helicase-2/ATP-dependent DNA helicase PcrA
VPAEVPLHPRPAGSDPPASHQAIRLFHLNRIAGRETSLADLHEIFRKHWQSEGFLTPEHEELRLQQGLKALEAFSAYERHEASVPSYVERRFSLMMDGIRLVGIFDRIDVADDAASGTIIDYKTSDVRTEEQATKRTKESLQLALYALAYQRLFDVLPVAVELRFLTPEVVVGRAVPSEKMIGRAVADTGRAAAGIRGALFPAEPIYRACRYCPYAAICPEKRTD